MKPNKKKLIEAAQPLDAINKASAAEKVRMRGFPKNFLSLDPACALHADRGRGLR